MGIERLELRRAGMPIVRLGVLVRVAALIEEPGHLSLVHRPALMLLPWPTMATQRRAVRVSSLGRREPVRAVQALDVSHRSHLRRALLACTQPPGGRGG